MKKIWATAIIIGLVLLNMSAVVSAGEYDLDIDAADVISGESGYKDTQALEQKSRIRYRYGQNSRFKVKFGGIWGFVDDNETKGYVGGYLAQRGCIGVLKGLWNKTDNSSKGRVVGILKRGFFNGRVVTPNGEKLPITGFYRINRENQTFHMRWMTPNKVGWAHCRIKVSNELPIKISEGITDQ